MLFYRSQPARSTIKGNHWVRRWCDHGDPGLALRLRPVGRRVLRADLAATSSVLVPAWPSGSRLSHTSLGRVRGSVVAVSSWSAVCGWPEP